MEREGPDDQEPAAIGVAAKLALLIASLVFSVLLAEIGLRVYHRVAAGTPVFAVFPGWRVESMAYSSYLAFGPRINFRAPDKTYPELAWFNERGFRTSEPMWPKRAGELRIATLGGSTTEDMWNASGRHWPWHLEQRLDALKIRDVRVLNGGMSAYATTHSLIRTAFDVTELRADVLLVMHNINDLTAAYYALAADTTLDPHYAIKYRTRGYTGLRGEEDVVWSRLKGFVAGRFESQRAATSPLPHDPVVVAEGARLFQRNLRSIIAVAQAHGIRPVLLTMPFSTSLKHFETTKSGQVRTGSIGIGRLPSSAQFFRDLERYNRATVALADTLGVTVVDMARLTEWNEDLFVDSVHLTDAGSERFGAVLATALGPLVLPPPSAPRQDRTR
jgi:lysophospholipase L1-like esterase